VSHDRLLTASGYPGTSFTPRLPVGLEAVAVGEEALPAVTCPLPAAPESARRARDFTRITLEDWSLAGVADLAELVVSELVTNALRHGLLSSRWMPDEHPIGLTLLRRDPYLMCLVTDPDPGGPVLMDPSTSAESGRGLQVVESCSEAWGWQAVEGAGKVVWALLR
jgi:anti-sigma regulatory factor (Ser/Thr protein kinase)